MDDLGYLKPPRALAAIQARTTELNFGMASEPRTGALLQMLAASKPGGRLLELGTGTGMATAWLLSGMDAASTLISVDTDEEVQAVAREILGHDTRLKLLSHDGAAFLWRCAVASKQLHLCGGGMCSLTVARVLVVDAVLSPQCRHQLRQALSVPFR